MALQDLWEGGKLWCMAALSLSRHFQHEGSQLKCCRLDGCSGLPGYKDSGRGEESKPCCSWWTCFSQYYLHCWQKAWAERVSRVSRAADGVQSEAESSTGPLRSALTTGNSVAARPLLSVVQASVQPLPLPEPLPSSSARQTSVRTSLEYQDTNLSSNELDMGWTMFWVFD